MELNLSFRHGLGDCANFAHILELFRRRGYRINLHCSDDKAIVFAPVGANIVPSDFPNLAEVSYPEAGPVAVEFADQFWRYNKPGINVAEGPLPHIGTPQELWDELCSVQLNVAQFVPGADRALVEQFLDSLPRPVVLIHSIGNTGGDRKAIPEDVTAQLYKCLLDRLDGTLILLDWDDRVPRLSHWRVRHLTDDLQWLTLPSLISLLDASDLLVGVDSGPMHLARMTNIPIVGAWNGPDLYPSRMALPRARTANVVPHDSTHLFNRLTRIPFNIVASPGNRLDPYSLADTCCRMISKPRYLSEAWIGADVQLQQFVLDWERGVQSSYTPYNDRHKGFDVVFRTIQDRYPAPLIVETGCLWAEDDWRGAGFSSYLFGAYLERAGGQLISIDIDPSHCEIARRITAGMPSVSVVTADSVTYLTDFGRKIDVLMIDSMDTWVPGFEDHALREVQAASPWLHERSLIIFDDTAYTAGNFIGKGKYAVPWLQDQGWRIIHSGLQAVLVREH